MPGGPLALAVALAGASFAPGTGTTEPADTAPSFIAEAATLCTDIVNERSFETWDAAEAAGVDVLTYAVDPPSVGAQPTGDEIDAWVGALHPRVDELTGTRERLGGRQDGADAAGAAIGLAWSQVVATGDEIIAAQAARLESLSSGQPWEAIAAGMAPLPIPATPPDAIATLGMILRDCEHVFTHQGVPSAARAFVAPAATACTNAVNRRTANGYFDDETILFDTGNVLYDGGPIEITDALVAAVDRRVAEHAATRDELGGVPTESVPDAAAWQTRLDFERALVDYYTGLAGALATGDPESVEAAIRVVINVPVDPDPLAALFLNERDCRLLHSATDPVPGGGIAPAAAPPAGVLGGPRPGNRNFGRPER